MDGWRWAACGLWSETLPLAGSIRLVTDVDIVVLLLIRCGGLVALVGPGV